MPLFVTNSATSSGLHIHLILTPDRSSHNVTTVRRNSSACAAIPRSTTSHFETRIGMLTLLGRLTAVIGANVGHCFLCMRKAFLTALGAWGTVLSISALGDPFGILSLIEIVAVALTVLWAAHIVVFARRSSTPPVSPKVAQPDLSRRVSLSMFGKMLAAAAAASAIPSLASAQNCSCGVCYRCDGSSYCSCCDSYCGCPAC